MKKRYFVSNTLTASEVMWSMKQLVRDAAMLADELCDMNVFMPQIVLMSSSNDIDEDILGVALTKWLRSKSHHAVVLRDGTTSVLALQLCECQSTGIMCAERAYVILGSSADIKPQEIFSMATAKSEPLHMDIEFTSQFHEVK